MKEPLPLATVQDAVLEFLRDRDDVVLFGAQAVNAYVDEARMTQDVDVMSTRAAEVAEELRAFLVKRFSIAVRVRVVSDGMGFRVYQSRKPLNRHLADIRMVTALPRAQRMADVPVIIPEELIAQKVIALKRREGMPKAGTDLRDIMMLLLAFPGLKTREGAVADALRAAAADDEIMEQWRLLAEMEIKGPGDTTENWDE